MNIKKCAAFALSAAIAFSGAQGIASPVYAAESTSQTKSDKTAETKALQAAITEVKKRISVPSKLSEFSYDTNTKYGTAYYTLKWYREAEREDYSGRKYKYTAESITVRYFNGFITGYDYYNEKSSSYGKRRFAKLTADEQQTYAEGYLKQLNPSLKGNAVFERRTSANSLTSQYVSYNISRVENGVDFKKNYGTVTIDRDTGKLISYSLTWWSDAVVPSTKKMLSESAVSEIYESKKGLTAYYEIFNRSEYDNKAGEWVYSRFALPVYVPANSGWYEIDAFTGEETAIYDDMKKYSKTDAYDWSGYDDDEFVEEEAFEDYEEEADEGYGSLTAAEIKALDEENSYISYSDALKIIKDDPFIVYDDKLISSYKKVVDYTDNKGDQRKKWSLQFKYTTSKTDDDNIYLDVDMDAETGEILSYSKDYYYGKDSKNKNTTVVKHASALARANKAASHFLGDKFKEYRYTDASKIYENSTSQSISYTRYVNGLEVPDDKIYVSVDSRDEVLGFSYTYHDMEFPEAKLVSKQDAYSKLFEHMKPELYYDGFADLQLKPHVYLTYRFDSSFMLNALTGERITYYGDAYYKDENPVTEKTIKYSDIKGYKYEKEINTLLDYGIYVTEDSRLDPDDDITVGEFVNLVNGVFGRSYYSRYSGKTEEETQKNLAKKMTRAELLKLYVDSYSGNSSAAKMTGIYKQFYTDIPGSDELCGYAAIGRYCGYISAQSGKFDPDGGFTKGELLKIAYDYLCTEKEVFIYDVIKL